MYEAFFGLREKPFSLLPDPDFLFLSSKHALALSMLEYSLAGQAGFCAISGEIGSGKTTLIRALLRRIGRDIALGLISNTHSTHTDIAGWALTAFGQRPTGQSMADRYQELMHLLINEYGAGRRCVLIVDEAQNLTIEALEELRLLSNINSGKDLLLQIILVGQPELLAKLKRPELRQFAQRISVSYHLAPLSCDETNKYIQFRLQVAGAARPIFTPMAIGGVHYFSAGVPRLINSICDMALVYSFADGKNDVDLDTIFRVISDRQSTGIAPFGESSPADIDSAVAEIAKLVNEGAQRAAHSSKISEPPLEPTNAELGSLNGSGTDQGRLHNGLGEPERRTEIKKVTKPRPTERREPTLQSVRRRDEPQPDSGQDSQIGPDGLPRLLVPRTTRGQPFDHSERNKAAASIQASDKPANARTRIIATHREGLGTEQAPAGDYRAATKADEDEMARRRSWFRRTFMRST